MIEEYDGIKIEYFPNGQCKKHDKIETIWRINAYIGEEFKDGWDFVFMRIDPKNPNPNERFYLASLDAVRKSGMDLAVKVKKEMK